MSHEPVSNKPQETTIISLKELSRPITLSTSKSHVLIIQTPLVVIDIIEAEDILFRTDSALLCPTAYPVEENGGENSDASENQKRIEGLAVLKGFFRYFQSCLNRGLEKRILITGHTDSVGSSSYNEKLSKKRAEVCLYLILGGAENRRKFAAAVIENHTDTDIQHVLKWLAHFLSWPNADPGDIDGKTGPKTNAACSAFKKNFKTEFPPKAFTDAGGAPAYDLSELQNRVNEDSKYDQLFWEAVFEVYQLDVRSALLKNHISLENVRARLTWVDDSKKTVGCGETWPLTARGVDNYRSQSNRRVEILFYDPSEFVQPIPCKDDICDKGDCHIFRELDRYKPSDDPFYPKLSWNYLPFAEEGEYSLTLQMLTSDLVNPTDVFVLTSDDLLYDKRLSKVDGVVNGGEITITFEGIPPLTDRVYHLYQQDETGEFIRSIFATRTFEDLFSTVGEEQEQIKPLPPDVEPRTPKENGTPTITHDVAIDNEPGEWEVYA